MPISMECPSCMNTFSVPDTMAGRKSNCPECKLVLFVPRGETTMNVVNGTTAPKGEPIQVKAVVPNPAKKERTVIKKTTATRPTASTGDQRGFGLMLPGLFALFILGGLLLLAGGGAAWYFLSRPAKAQVATTGQETPKEETRKAEPTKDPLKDPTFMVDTKKDPPKIPGGKPIRDTFDASPPPKNLGSKPSGDTIDNPPPSTTPGSKPSGNTIDAPPTSNPKKNGRLTLSLNAPLAAKPGERVTVNIKVLREDCKGPVSLEFQPESRDVVEAPVRMLPADVDRVSITLVVDPKAKAEQHSLQVKGKLDDLTDAKVALLNVETPTVVTVPRPLGVAGKWQGYFGQPAGPLTKDFNILIDLEPKDGALEGTVRKEMRNKPQFYCTMKVKVQQQGDTLMLVDDKVVEIVNPPGGFWLTHATFQGQITKEGVISGTWTDPTANGLRGKGAFIAFHMEYHIVIQRKEKKADGVVAGTLFLNGVELGSVTENAEKLIPAGIYPGKVRMASEKSIVQSAGGRLGQKGDFLLEIANVPKRSDILIRPSTNAKSPEGCVAAGGAGLGCARLLRGKRFRRGQTEASFLRHGYAQSRA